MSKSFNEPHPHSPVQAHHQHSPRTHSLSFHDSHSNSRDKIDVQQHESDSYARLLLLNQCYEAMPTSSKMVVFDMELVLRKAFNGLIYQNTRHVLLSESGGGISGILSVTDFIRIMLKLHREKVIADFQRDDASPHPQGIEDIGTLTIKKYREIIANEGKLKDLVVIDADRSLLEAARLLAAHHIHRLPVLDPENGSPLFILTHKRLLKFLWCFGQQFSQPEYHIRTAKELGVGTWVGIRVVFPDTPLHDCLDILLNKGVSGLPVVERDTFKVVDMYSRFDAIGIALEDRSGSDSLDVTVEQALAFKNTFKTEKNRVVSVRDTDTLWKAVTVLVESNVHRLCAVNEHGSIEGVISLSDVINHMVVMPGEHLKVPKVHKKHYNHHHGELSDKDLRSMLSDSAAILEDTATGRIHNDLQSMTIHTS